MFKKRRILWFLIELAPLWLLFWALSGQDALRYCLGGLAAVVFGLMNYVEGQGGRPKVTKSINIYVTGDVKVDDPDNEIKL